jgi:hypothetical protein
MKDKPEEKIKQSKDWRQRLDVILQEMKTQQLDENEPGACRLGGRNLSLSITHLEDAIMRQGMRCKDLDAPNPYPTSYDPSTAKVEPTADGIKL